MTGFGSIDEAVQAMRLGAYDFLTKPIDVDHLRLVVERALRERALQDEVTPAARAAARAVRLPATSSARTRRCTPSSS